MRTYIQNKNGEIFAVHASPKRVKNLPRIVGGEFKVIKATKELLDAAKFNILVKNLRIVSDNLSYL